MIEGRINAAKVLDLESPQGLYVMKFGGTSVGGVRPIKRVTNIVEYYRRQTDGLVIVVSALRGVTNKLVNVCKYAGEGDKEGSGLALEDIFYQHLEVIEGLDLSTPLRNSLDRKVSNLFFSLEREVGKIEEVTPEKSDLILSYGERFSVRILEASLLNRGVMAEAIDADNIIETNNNFGAAVPNMEKTARYARPALNGLLKEGTVPIVTGFIGSTSQDKITTLGRGGSDFTASILGRILGASEVWIWTDVDGVYNYDPRYNPQAAVYAELSQFRAHQMAKNGARVLYEKTVEPLLGTDIVLRVKNTFNPEAEGTKIYHM